MNRPTLVKANVAISYTANDGYSSEIGFKGASTKHQSQPAAAMLGAVEELARICALFGIWNEALERVTSAKARVDADLSAMESNP